MTATEQTPASTPASQTVATNRHRLVRQSVVGEVTPPRVRPDSPYRISIHGEPRVLPATGGVTYNVRVGHRVRDIVGDHVEPAVSMKNPDEMANGGLNVLASVGNTATVLTGAAAGATGVVTGKHGGAEHVMVDFPTAVLEQMIPGIEFSCGPSARGSRSTTSPISAA